MVYTDDQLAVQTINLAPTGNGPGVLAAAKKPGLSAAVVSVRRDGTVCVSAPGVVSPVSMTLFAMNGRVAFSENAMAGRSEGRVVFRVPGSVAAGMYAVRVRWDNTIQWKTMRLVR
jgi:hypothetical protein